MPRPRISDKPLTPAERSKRRWDRMQNEIAILTRKVKRYEALYGPLPDDAGDAEGGSPAWTWEDVEVIE